ncbi:MAG TPA: hypothetical protein DCR35_17690, partial [Runella sp.]|nr:hypothetical protein [Runella sp.]
MDQMFSGAAAFNQNISGWNVSNVTDLRAMFYTTALFNQNLANWNIGNATFMQDIFYYSDVNFSISK